MVFEGASEVGQSVFDQVKIVSLAWLEEGSDANRMENPRGVVLVVD